MRQCGVSVDGQLGVMEGYPLQLSDEPGDESPPLRQFMDLKTGTFVNEPFAEDAFAEVAAMCPGGILFAHGRKSRNETQRFLSYWNRETKKVDWTKPLEAKLILTAAFSPKGDYVLVSEWSLSAPEHQATTVLLASATGRESGRFDAHANYLAFANDGTYFVSATTYDNHPFAFAAWSIASGKKKWEESHAGDCIALSVTKESAIAAFTFTRKDDEGARRFELKDATTGKLIRTFPRPE